MKFFTNWIESMVRRCVAAEVNTAFKSLACDPAHVANQLEMAADEVARHVEMDALAELLAEKVDVDTSEIARVVARNLDMDDVIEKVVEEIDMGQVCDRCAEKIEIDTDDARGAGPAVFLQWRFLYQAIFGGDDEAVLLECGEIAHREQRLDLFALAQ